MKNNKRKKDWLSFSICVLIVLSFLALLDLLTPEKWVEPALMFSVLILSMALLNNYSQSQEMQYCIDHDELTDLYSKKCFNAEIEKMLTCKREIAVLFIDLDGFKKVNDSMGHWAGDKLLKIAAFRIQRSVRPFDKAFRLGGDELAVIIVDLNQYNKINICKQIAQRIIEQVGRPYSLEQGVAKVTCSIGIALSEDSFNQRELVCAADSAMYEAKNKGKNKFIFSKSAYN